MSSEYDPVLGAAASPDDGDLEAVRERFAAAGQPYLGSPWPWLAWALLLPAAALATPLAAARFGAAGVLFLWSGIILAGGAVEAGVFLRRRGPASTLSRWVLRLQGNLSLVALALSLALLWHGQARMLPGLWLLLLGHSLFGPGGLAFRPLRVTGLIYQLGGVAALWPGGSPLAVFAAAVFAGNLWTAISVARAAR